MKRTFVLGLVGLSTVLLTFACSSAQPVKSQAYAKLKQERTFEYEFPVVWKGIEAVFEQYHGLERDPAEVEPQELRKLTKRTLETDWIIGQSRDKYVEYKINGSSRKKYLQTRLKYFIKAESQLGGTSVNVRVTEEIENLDSKGQPAGYSRVSEIDSSRGGEILDKIEQAVLSAAP